LFLPAPFWFEAENSPWACVRDAVPRILNGTDPCATCPHWEPQSGAPAGTPGEKPGGDSPERGFSV
jgi:hypothetical protein